MHLNRLSRPFLVLWRLVLAWLCLNLVSYLRLWLLLLAWLCLELVAQWNLALLLMALLVHVLLVLLVVPLVPMH